MNKPYLSVVIPSYNETENLRRGVLDEVNNFLKEQRYDWEVVISDDGSTDSESISLAKSYCASNTRFKFLENIHAGKPFAVWAGIQSTQGEIVLFTDMDQSTPISEIDKLLPYFGKGYDVVIGSRGSQRKNVSIFRLIASKIFIGLRKSMLLRQIADTQAGFKSFKGSVAKEVFPLLQVISGEGRIAKGWKVTSFDVELLVVTEKRGYKIAEVPVDWEDRDVSTKKSRGTIKFIKESIDMAKEIFRVKFNLFKGFYD